MMSYLGVYSVVLSVFDNEDNIRRSRRFVFFDNVQNDVTIDPNTPMRVLPLDGATEDRWVTFSDSTPWWGRRVQLDWKGHFLNGRHVNQGLLKPIGSFANGIIDAGEER